MSNCKKDHSSISSIMDELPIEQGGAGRHKCAACAYELGYSDGSKRNLQIDINRILENLPTSQAGSQRHKSAYLAYIRGYYDGLIGSYQVNNSEYDQIDEMALASLVHENAGGYNNSLNNRETAEDRENADIMREQKNDLLNYKIEDLINHELYQFNDFNNKYFSFRTFNVLRRQGIITLHDVVNFKGDIRRIPGAGRKAEVEFDYLKDYIYSLIEKFGSSTSVDNSNNDSDGTEPDGPGATLILLNSLSDEKRMIADFDFLQMIENWENRKASLFIKKYSLHSFVSTFCDKPNNTILNAKGIGHQTGESIILFKYQLTKYLINLSGKDYDPIEQRWELISRSLSEELQSDFSSVIGQDLREYYLTFGHVPFFQLTELLFFMMASDSKYGSSFVHRCFSNADSYPVFEEDDHSYETDRIRSSRVLDILKRGETRIPSNDYVLYNCVSDYTFLVNSKENQYIADKLNRYDIITEKNIGDFLSSEKCEYLESKEALSVLGESLSKVFTTYGGLFNNDDFEGVYLIKNNYSNIYNFKEAIAFFREVVESNHSEELKFNLRDFVRDRFEYWNNQITSYDCIENIISILSKLLREELKLEGCLFMDELTLEPNARKTMKEMVYEALKDLGQPSTPEEILAIIKEKENCETIDVAKVQARLASDDRIVAIKFDHRYDLITNNPLVGSIRDFINDILQASDVPLSSQEIYSKMPESRKTGIDSFHSNLKQMDNVQKYIDGLYGLKGKVYGKEYVLDIHANFTASDKLAKITNFVRQNNRLPASSDGPDWKQLRSWWDRLPYRQESITDDEWKSYQALAKEVESLKNGSAVDMDFEEKANQVIEYIRQHHSLPTKLDNAPLANWYQKQWKRFLNDNLSDDQLRVFVNVLKAKSDHA